MCHVVRYCCAISPLWPRSISAKLAEAVAPSCREALCEGDVPGMKDTRVTIKFVLAAHSYFKKPAYDPRCIDCCTHTNSHHVWAAGPTSVFAAVCGSAASWR